MNEPQNIPFFYEPGFMDSWLKKLVRDPQVAIIEIVANGLDAGADKIEISVPEEYGEDSFLVFTDNGTGMTHEEFLKRWQTLSYDRRKEQGNTIEYPPNNARSTRKPFGKNGKGRFSMFCFASSYEVETCKKGEINRYKISMNEETNMVPYSIISLSTIKSDRENSWTKVKAVPQKNLLSPKQVEIAIAERYLYDPSLSISVNSNLVSLASLDLYEKEERQLDTPLGSILISFIKSQKSGHTSLRSGIAWWTNSKLIGDINWNSKIDGNSLFDARTTFGKKYVFFVIADVLDPYLNEQNDGYDTLDNSDESETIQLVEREILEWINKMRQASSRDIRQTVLQNNIDKIDQLGYLGKTKADDLLQGIQNKIPTIGKDELGKIIEVFIKLEISSSGKELLTQISRLSEEDIDMLNTILQNWEVINIKTILDELGKRINLIQTMEKILNDENADELHDIHPLFEQGLWIFGPEFESLEFTSNRSMTTVVRKLLKKEGFKFNDEKLGRTRPDVVVCADSTILHYERDGFDDEKPSGFERVLVIELKRGGSKINGDNVYQAEKYCLGILKSGNVENSKGCIKAYVIGSTIDQETATIGSKANGDIIVYPCTFGSILRKAHQRTFNLQKKIRKNAEARNINLDDPEIYHEIQKPLFDMQTSN